MIGHELTVEQGEAGEAHARHQPGQRDLRRVGAARDHGFAEEGGAERDAIEAAHKLLPVPHLDRMGEAAGVEIAIGAFDRMVDPGRRAIRRGGGAERQYLSEGAVGGDAELVAAQHLGQRTRQVEPFERQDRAEFGLDPIDFPRVAVVRHGEDTNGIGLQQDQRIDQHAARR